MGLTGAKEVLRRSGTTLEHAAFTGAEAEITFDTDKKSMRIHDGSRVGGWEAAHADPEIKSEIKGRYFPNTNVTDHGAGGADFLAGNLKAVLDEIGTDNAVIEMASGVWNIATNLSIPQNITLVPQRGAVLSMGSGVTLTIHSPDNIQALSSQQIFDGDGSVVFSVNGKVYPDYWKENIVPGSTDMSEAIQSAVIASDNVVFNSTKYAMSDSVTLSGVCNLGSHDDYKAELIGPQIEVPLNDSISKVMFVSTSSDSDITMRGITLNFNSGRSVGKDNGYGPVGPGDNGIRVVGAVAFRAFDCIFTNHTSPHTTNITPSDPVLSDEYDMSASDFALTRAAMGIIVETSEVVLKDCKIHANGTENFYIFSEYSTQVTRLTVEGCHFYDLQRSGLSHIGWLKEAIIKDNFFYDSAGFSPINFHTNNIEIAGNVIRDATESFGIDGREFFWVSDNVNIHDNTVINCKWDGVAVCGSNIKVRDNTITDCQGGILLRSTLNSTYPAGPGTVKTPYNAIVSGNIIYDLDNTDDDSYGMIIQSEPTDTVINPGAVIVCDNIIKGGALGDFGIILAGNNQRIQIKNNFIKDLINDYIYISRPGGYIDISENHFDFIDDRQFFNNVGVDIDCFSESLIIHALSINNNTIEGIPYSPYFLNIRNGASATFTKINMMQNVGFDTYLVPDETDVNYEKTYPGVTSIPTSGTYMERSSIPVIQDGSGISGYTVQRTTANRLLPHTITDYGVLTGDFENGSRAVINVSDITKIKEGDYFYAPISAAGGSLFRVVVRVDAADNSFIMSGTADKDLVGGTISSSFEAYGNKLVANAVTAVTSTTAALIDNTNAINTSAAKVSGYPVYNSTTGMIVYASGNADSDAWYYAGGTLAHTPV